MTPLQDGSSAETAPYPVLRDEVRVDRLDLEMGGGLAPCTVAFEAQGRLDLPAVVILGGISASRHSNANPADEREGWWSEFVGAGKTIDPTEYLVIGIDYLGGPGGSSGPNSPEVLDGTIEVPEGRFFPPVTPGDQAAAAVLVLDHLGIERSRAVIGASYGGMVALAFAVRFPERTGHSLVISAAHESHPMAIAAHALQRRIIHLGIETGREREGVILARALAMTTYRSADEFAERFSGPPEPDGKGGWRFPVESYLEHQGVRFADSFDAKEFLSLCESLDLHRVRPEEVGVATTILAVDNDALVPMEQVHDLYGRLGAPGELVVIQSLYGHDAFLKEVEKVGPVVERVLSGVPPSGGGTISKDEPGSPAAARRGGAAR